MGEDRGDLTALLKNGAKLADGEGGTLPGDTGEIGLKAWEVISLWKLGRDLVGVWGSRRFNTLPKEGMECY